MAGDDITIHINAQDTATRILNDVSKRLTSFATSTVGSLAAVGAGFAALRSVMNGIAAAATGITDAANAIDDLWDKAKGLGTTVGDLQAFQFAMQETGNVGAEKSIQALQKIQKIIGEVATGDNDNAFGIFERMGLDVEQLALQPIIDQFMAVKAAIAGIENPAERASVATALLGKSAADLVPALISSQEEFEESMNAAAELGGAMDNATAEGIANMNDALGRVSFAIQGMYGQIAGELAPLAQEVARWITDWIPPIVDIARQWLPVIADHFIIITGTAKGLAVTMSRLATFDLAGAADAIADFEDGIVKSLVNIRVARQKASDEAMAATANATAAAISGINEIADKEAEAAAKREKAIADEAAKRDKASKDVIHNLERQIEVMQLGEDNVKDMENLAAAANDKDRARIDYLQKELALLKDAADIEEEMLKTEKERQREQEKKDKEIIDKATKENEQEQERQQRLKEQSPTVQGHDARLLTRGTGVNPMQEIARNTKHASALLDRIKNRLQQPLQVEDTNASPGDQETLLIQMMGGT